MEISGKGAVRQIARCLQKLDQILGGPWSATARHFEARRTEIRRVRIALADWRGGTWQQEREPDDLTVEELVEIEKILRISALASAETEHLSGLYESVMMRVSAAEGKIASLASTIEKAAGTANERK
jgi:hypothetical protein